ncbi:unnamed protein product [Thelazia callipaeda]|uniref:F-box domain-containing protein n=1 Tax=Thelazia callipaeda TaxID=103827 RepID=A0A0N5CZN7_THECL|nr:unnamed protein product [Thelazia callipaeda]
MYKLGGCSKKSCPEYFVQTNSYFLFVRIILNEYFDHRKFQLLCAVEQIDALSTLVNECSLDQIKHLRSLIEPFFKKDFIRELPKEIALYIMSFLSPSDITRMSLTCRYWRSLAENNRLWKQKCAEANVKKYICSVYLLNKYYFFLRFFSALWKAVYLRHRRILANWRYRPLSGSCILKGHDEHVITCLQIRGDIIVTGSDDNTLKIWSASKATVKRFYFCFPMAMYLQHMLQFGHTGGVWSSQILATGSRDTTVRVWNIKEGTCKRILEGHVAAVRCVQFDGVRIVSGAYDFSIKVWNAESGECLHTLTGHSNRVYSLLFDSERDIVVSGSLDTTIKVWNIREGVCVHTLIGHQSLTSGMQLRGSTLVSGNADSTIRIWDISDGQCKYTLSGSNRHASAVTSLVFLENGLVATSSDDGSVKLWDIKHGVFVRDLVRLRSGGSGGCIWRLKATPTMLVCAVGSRNGTEDTKLILLDFDADYP